jgi:multidrug resistance efflux pump
MSERLPPIPTPPAQLWRQLRLQYLPVVVFVAGLLAAAVIWTRWVAPPTLVGEAEAVRADVRSTLPGQVVSLNVELLQAVKAGDVIGQVAGDPKILEASLAVVRAEIELMRTTLDPVASQQRIAVDLERLQLDWLTKRVELVTLQGQLHQAEATLARAVVMHQSKLMTDEQFDQAKNTRDSLQAQVEAQTDLIRRLEPGMRNLNVEGSTAIPSATQGLAAAIKGKEQELRLIEAQLGPTPLIAPIDGVVTLIYRRAGEAVTLVDPIVQIGATRSERIIGFLRQPLTIEPKPGMLVDVRTRTFLRKTGTASITQVGLQLEPITPTLLTAMRLPVTNIPTEFGLRVHIAPPEGLKLRPGEQVDLIIRE